MLYERRFVNSKQQQLTYLSIELQETSKTGNNKSDLVTWETNQFNVYVLVKRDDYENKYTVTWYNKIMSSSENQKQQLRESDAVLSLLFVTLTLAQSCCCFDQSNEKG